MAIKKTIEVELKTKQAQKNVDDLTESVEKLDETVEEVGDSSEKTGDDLEKGFDKGAGGAKRLAIGIRGIGIAFKAAGIGLIVAAFAQFQELFAGDTITDALTTAAETLNNIFAGQGLSEAFNNAQATLDLRKQLEVAEREFQITQLKGQKIAEQERQIRDDVSLSISERIAANERLGVELDNQLEKELQLAQANRAFLETENAKLGTQASLLALKDAEVKILEVEERIVSQSSEQKVNAVALQRELNQLIVTEAELEDGNLILRSARNVAELTLIESRKRALEEDFNRQIAFNDFRLEQEKEGTQAYADLLAERKALDEDYQANSIALEDASVKAKEDILQNFGNALIDVFGKASTIGKAVAIAQAIWNVNEGITKALTLPPPWSFIAAATTALQGFAAVRNIVNTPNPIGEEPAGNAASTSAPQITAPQFNVVGASGTNQLAESISQQTNTPIKAFVVGKDVSTQQEMDRNIVKTATFG